MSNKTYRFRICARPTWDNRMHRFFFYATDEDQALADFYLAHSDRFADAEIVSVRNLTLHPPKTR